MGDINYQLEAVEYLLELIGNPHKKLKVIHVGGTNGKGSTVSMIASILKEEGYKVGAFRKPHMTNFTERISINDVQIPESKIVEMINEMKPAIEKVAEKYYHPTFFEITAAIMFKYFADQNVDFAVVEVGIGGRLDATNTTESLLSIITNVSLEHTAILGDTIEEIAREKGGIIKDNGLLITSAEQNEVIDIFGNICGDKKSNMIVVGKNKDIEYEKIKSDINEQTFNIKTPKNNFHNLQTNLVGEHQMINSAVAIGAIESLKQKGVDISEQSIRNGLKNVKWPGRFEIMQKDPYVVLDGAKDMLASKNLSKTINEFFPNKKTVLVVSISKGKKIKEILNDLVPISDHIILSEHKVMNRAESSKNMATLVGDKNYETVLDVKDATKRAIELAGNDGIVLVTGSIFTIGEARELWHKNVDFVWGRELNES